MTKLEIMKELNRRLENEEISFENWLRNIVNVYLYC